MDSRTEEPISARQARLGVYTWSIQNPLFFKVVEHIQQPFNSLHDIITVQIQFNHNLRKELGLHKCWIRWKIWTMAGYDPDVFLPVFQSSVISFLYNLGVISINNVIRAVDHMLWEEDQKYTIQVEQSQSVAYKLY
ncbi:replication enhancer protein [Camellia oleifera geminivirus]|nr:replication enhancer protein [Camellia oleifera geminivirus]